MASNRKPAGPATAGEVRVGDRAEFEPGVSVIVEAIERRFDGSPLATDPDPEQARGWGHALMFWCCKPGKLTRRKTFYMRRERSPLSGPGVVR